jgi:hypothetical protein
LRETIAVSATFDGDPLPGQGRYNPPNRDVFLGWEERLVDDNNVATFDHTRVPLADYNRLSDNNYFVTVNVYSARKVTRDNLLDCGVPIDRIEMFRGKTVVVECRLIGESPS